MTPSVKCPDCGRYGSRYGLREIRQSYLSDAGVLCRRTVTVQRHRCPDCDRLFQDPSGPDHAAALDTVARSAMAFGIAGGAKRHGCDAGTVSRFLAEWSEQRRDEVTSGMPEVLGLASLPVAGRGCAIAFCPSSGQVLDLVGDVPGIGAWIAGHDDMPSAVCIEIDAGMLAALSVLPGGMRLLVPPSAAARSIEAGAIALFRKLVRGSAPGRNYRESMALFRKPQADLSDADREELKNWNEAPRKLRFATTTLLHDLQHGRPAAAADTMAMTVALLAAIAPSSNLARFLDRWSPAILRGAEDRWIDGGMTEAAALRRDAAAMRPLAGYDRMRAIMMFATPRGAAPIGTSGSAVPTEALGPQIDDVRATIAHYAGLAA